MLEKIGGWSPRMKLIAGGSTAIAVIAGVALIVALAASGSSIPDSAPCEDFVRSGPGEQSDYLVSKLEGTPSSIEVTAYGEGVALNCSKGYGESIGESVERTDIEIREVAAEGGDLNEGVALIRERTEGRELFGEITEEFEGP